MTPRKRSSRVSMIGGWLDSVVVLFPGVVLCVFITLVSMGMQNLEERAFGHPYVEALVIAILLGMAIRTIVRPTERWRAGIAFNAKQLLEIAVMLHRGFGRSRRDLGCRCR